MGDAARKIVVDETRIRRVLGRWLAPGIVKTAIAEIFEAPEVAPERKATPEEIERARADARREAKR